MTWVDLNKYLVDNDMKKVTASQPSWLYGHQEITPQVDS